MLKKASYAHITRTGDLVLYVRGEERKRVRLTQYPGHRDEASQIIGDLGFVPGVDGWRIPLDPGGDLVTTCALVPQYLAADNRVKDYRR